MTFHPLRGLWSWLGVATTYDLSLLEHKLMTLAQDLEAELVTLNETTTEMAADIDDLVAKIGSGDPAAEAAALAKLKEHSATLRALADKHTP